MCSALSFWFVFTRMCFCEGTVRRYHAGESFHPLVRVMKVASREVTSATAGGGNRVHSYILCTFFSQRDYFLFGDF